MPPKPKTDPNDIKIVYLRCIGGERGAISSLAAKVGPLGLSPHQISEEIMRVTSDWKGLKVTCKLTIHNRQARIEVVPSAASLIIKELKEFRQSEAVATTASTGATTRGRRNGNLTLDMIINIARTMRPRSMAKKLEGTVKEILGTCQSVGCTVDGMHPHDVIEKIRARQIAIPKE